MCCVQRCKNCTEEKEMFFDQPQLSKPIRRNMKYEMFRRYFGDIILEMLQERLFSFYLSLSLSLPLPLYFSLSIGIECFSLQTEFKDIHFSLSLVLTNIFDYFSLIDTNQALFVFLQHEFKDLNFSSSSVLTSPPDSSTIDFFYVVKLKLFPFSSIRYFRFSTDRVQRR